MSKLSTTAKLHQQYLLLQRSFPGKALAECTKAFQMISEALDALPLEASERLAEYDADDLAEMHLGVLEAEAIIIERARRG